MDVCVLVGDGVCERCVSVSVDERFDDDDGERSRKSELLVRRCMVGDRLRVCPCSSNTTTHNTHQFDISVYRCVQKLNENGVQLRLRVANAFFAGDDDDDDDDEVG